MTMRKTDNRTDDIDLDTARGFVCWALSGIALWALLAWITAGIQA